MKRLLTFAFFFSALLLSACKEDADVRAARQTLIRTLGDRAKEINLTKIEKQDSLDVYRYEVKNGKLRIEGSSPTAMCRAFYDYVRSNGYGMVCWSGTRMELPEKLKDTPIKEVISPYLHHYYFNVVTYGYSMPYWDWERWEKELDWMALHGIDMPLAMVGTEAIAARVYEQFGFTKEEIYNYFVGPAHLPWMRMGNISYLDSPQPEAWNVRQVELQHKILKRMKELGMKPIFPGFAGFVPKEIKERYPDTEVIETKWFGGAFNNWLVSPNDTLFTAMSKAFIEEWEKEFGKGEYYEVDSFNEMEIDFPPVGSQERTDLLASFGEKIYDAIKAGNPDAVWVMQGWMFGYQRNVWDKESTRAFLSRIPDDKMLIIDLGVDYNVTVWQHGPNWEQYDGLFGKPWVYSVIPNMGDNTGPSADLPFYANARLDALNSPNKGNLKGFGFAPEGIETNELVYELLTDAGWRTDSIDLDNWIEQYSLSRYGACPEAMKTAFGHFRKSVYRTIVGRPSFTWNFRPETYRGGVKVGPDFEAGIRAFVSCADSLKDSPLYRNDLIEWGAMYCGAKAEEAANAAMDMKKSGKIDLDSLDRLQAKFDLNMRRADSLLESHPLYRLQLWIDQARNSGDTPELKDYYERNARRIVTVWGPPVDDYSSRIWSGLIRDYYVPRWDHYFESIRSGKPFDFTPWELEWVEATGITPPAPYADPVKAVQNMIPVQ